MKKLLLLSFPLLLTQLAVHAQYAAGGPDAYGYTWRDSNEPNGPTFAWFNITSIGTQVTGLGDDNVVGPFGFIDGFQFYWYLPQQVWIGSNGYLTFNGANIASPFPSIPNTAAPNDFIAPFLSDLNFAGTGNPGTCYFFTNADTICVSWINVPFWNVSTGYAGSNSFQVILNRADKSITYNYLSQSGTTNANDITIGIENITGQLGLQHSKNQYPSQNYSIKFYYPTTVTYQAIDGGVNWNMNEGNGAIFTKIQTPTELKTNIRNFGNQPLSNINVNSVVSRAGTPSVNNTAQVNSMIAGVDTTINLTNLLTPPVPGIYNLNTTISGITGDLVAANNSLRTKIIAVDTAAPVIVLDYSDGLPDGAGLSWSGGSGGIGYYIEPPFYPCKIDAYRMYITSDATGQGCILKIYDDDGPNGGPGTLLDSTVAGPGSFGLNSYSSILLSNNVVIQSGGFYVLWEMPGGSSITLARDLTPPISFRAMEVLGGAWAGYRSRTTEDFLLGVEASQFQLVDLALLSITNISVGSVLNTPTSPVIVVKNVGQLANQAVNLRFQFAGGAIVTESLFANVINPGDSLMYTFNGTISAPTTRTGDLCVWLNMAGDMNASNDSICFPLTYEVNNTSVAEGWLQQLRVYPIPAENHLIVSGLENAIRYEIRDMRGALLAAETIDDATNTARILINQLPAGVYQLILNDGDFVRQIRFIKKP
jgi:hypothetical protein